MRIPAPIKPRQTIPHQRTFAVLVWKSKHGKRSPACYVFLKSITWRLYGWKIFAFTLEEEIYERPCIVDDSKNSRKISIFIDGVAFIGGKRCKDRCLVFSTLDVSSYSNQTLTRILYLKKSCENKQWEFSLEHEKSFLISRLLLKIRDFMEQIFHLVSKHDINLDLVSKKWH